MIVSAGILHPQIIIDQVLLAELPAEELLTLVAIEALRIQKGFAVARLFAPLLILLIALFITVVGACYFPNAAGMERITVFTAAMITVLLLERYLFENYATNKIDALLLAEGVSLEFYVSCLNRIQNDSKSFNRRKRLILSRGEKRC
ncbi:hypothetical protein [Paenibacillus glufosinatiresistens]|uniref:hypothetical protein n=1 Tax=Paenibacillus glufosinatiresistens TaxID=3070657 RepID=UPI00286E1FAD|nr:hypothetical protein [Paenibacillus sp. YX.27]